MKYVLNSFLFVLFGELLFDVLVFVCCLCNWPNSLCANILIVKNLIKMNYNSVHLLFQFTEYALRHVGNFCNDR